MSNARVRMLRAEIGELKQKLAIAGVVKEGAMAGWMESGVRWSLVQGHPAVEAELGGQPVDPDGLLDAVMRALDKVPLSAVE